MFSVTARNAQYTLDGVAWENPQLGDINTVQVLDAQAWIDDVVIEPVN